MTYSYKHNAYWSSLFVSIMSGNRISVPITASIMPLPPSIQQQLPQVQQQLPRHQLSSQAMSSQAATPSTVTQQIFSLGHRLKVTDVYILLKATIQPQVS